MENKPRKPAGRKPTGKNPVLQIVMPAEQKAAAQAKGMAWCREVIAAALKAAS